jgi:hypothetical protein
MNPRLVSPVTPSPDQPYIPISHLYQVRNHRLCSSIPPYDPLQPFTRVTLRPIGNEVSALAMLLNSAAKVRALRSRSPSKIATFPQDLQNQFVTLEAIQEEIWFKPRPAEGSLGDQILVAETEAATQRKNLSAMTRLQHRMADEGLTSKATAAEEEDDLVEEEFDSASEEDTDSAHLSDPDTLDVDGLTRREFKLLIKELHDPFTPTKRRAEIGNIILFGVDGAR